MFIRSLNVGGALALGLAIAGATQAEASQIVSAVESEGSGSADTQVGSTAGQVLSTTYGGAATKALTDYGVNKIVASGNAGYEQYATSAWLDTYTVGGAAGSTVHVTFAFSIDGLANFTGNDASFNFNVYALRGAGWSMSGYGSSPGVTGAGTSGTAYERLLLTQTVPGTRVTQADMRDFDGFYNYGYAAGGAAGAFGSHVSYDAATDTYTVETSQTIGGALHDIEARYGPASIQTFRDGVPLGAPTPYSLAAPAAATRAGLDANFSLLAIDQLCIGEGCEASGLYPGSDLVLSFDLAAGSQFTLATMLYADDLTDGTIDFFHTAKVTQITTSGGASLVNDSNTLVARSGGTFSLAAVDAISPTPEPATWATMLIGFGATGSAIRLRRRKPRFV